MGVHGSCGSQELQSNEKQRTNQRRRRLRHATEPRSTSKHLSKPFISRRAKLCQRIVGEFVQDNESISSQCSITNKE